MTEIMRCNEFQKEFDGGNALGEAALLHLKECANCRKTKREQNHIWQVIGNFKKVEAPKDFGFRVQARIAQAKSGDYTQNSFLPWLRYVVPILLVGAVFAFIAIGNFNLFDNQNAAQIAANQPQTKQEINLPNEKIAVNEQLPENSAAENETPEVAQKQTNPITKSENEKAIAENLKKKNPRNKPNVNVPEDDFTGSRDSAVKGNSTVILPPNMTGNQTNKNPNDNAKAKTFSVQEVLSQIGIETAGETRTVKTVRENSLAARSGVKTGDIIEAIDGQKLNEELLGNKTVEGKTLTILRDGKKLEINLVSSQN